MVIKKSDVLKSTWSSDPDKALRVMKERIAYDEGNGYLTLREANKLRGIAHGLWVKGKKAMKGKK